MGAQDATCPDDVRDPTSDPDGSEPTRTTGSPGPFGFGHPESARLRQRTVRDLVDELARLHDEWGAALLSSQAADRDSEAPRIRARRIIVELRRRHHALHRTGQGASDRLSLGGAVHTKAEDAPEDVMPGTDPHWQLHAARRYVVRAGAAADARSHAPADPWGLASAALQDALALLESCGARRHARSDAAAPLAVPCAELIRYALTAIRIIPGWNDSSELTDAFRVALVALELVERQSAR